ncbi:MAG: NeuD/PglB/VioB family sugar acetyltransferase [Candidatus Cloacimonetes bacterium]|nr:NeuD/PglB/VioB family sugar acetyltransferase [Candidatus Cloacimonadota bacterium]
MKDNIIIIGGEGNGSVIADAITDAHLRGSTSARIYGFLNDRMNKGDLIAGYPVLGSLADVQFYLKQDCRFVYAIYRIDGQKQRIELFRNLKISEDSMLTFIHPLAYVAPSARIGQGVIIMPQVSVSAEAVIGDCCLLMVHATIGHNTVLGSHCHLAAQSCLSSHVTLEEGVHIGLNATVREHLTLKKNSTLGMGSVLLNDICEQDIWAGNPARFIRKAL